MLDCKDPALTALRDKGFNVVLTPKADLVPTQLLMANGKKLQRLGDLDSVFLPDPGQVLPKITFNAPAPSISGNKTKDLSVGVGVKILNGLIGALGGSTLGVSVAYKKAKSVVFEYSDVTVDHAAPALIDTYLSLADVNPHGQAAHDLLSSDRVYVITAVIKAKTLKVDAKGENGASVGVDVPIIADAVGGNIKVESKGAGASTLVYKADIPLAFGFQAVRLDFTGTTYKTMKMVKAGDIALESTDHGRSAAEGEPELLVLDGVGAFTL